MITVGNKFPEFQIKATVANDVSNAFQMISNETYRGKWLVVFFWPKDFTFVCPTEIAEFGRLNSEFADRDAQILGGSTDSEFVHLAWRNQHPDLNNLPFPMLADVKRELTANLGILDDQEGVAQRATFIVDPQGITRFVMVTDLNVGRNPAEVLRVLDALQTDELCPCNWKKVKKQFISNKLKKEASIMLENVKESIPEVAKDIRLNLTKVLDLEQSDGLSEHQILGSALAVSYSLGNEVLIKGLKELVHNEQIVRAAQLAASLMAMTNIYYRFVHLTEIKEIEHIPAGLRMQGMMTPGVDRVTFEILSLAVSALNGCGACVSSHARQLKEHGLSDTSLARVGRITAVIHAVHVSGRIK